MKQVDFDETLRQMRVEHRQRTQLLKKMVADLDLQKAEHLKLVHKMNQDYEELKAQRAMLNKEIERLDCKYNTKYREFLQEHQGHVSRQLEDVSDWALVKELAARGYTLNGGCGLYHPEQADEWLMKLNGKLKPKNSDSDDNSKD